MTRARARQINDQVLSLLCTYDLTNENIILHSCLDLLVLRNEGVGEIRRKSRMQMEDEKCCMLIPQAATLLTCKKVPSHVRAEVQKEEKEY